MLICYVFFKSLFIGLLDPQKFAAAKLRGMVKAAAVGILATGDVATEGRGRKTKAQTWSCAPAWRGLIPQASSSPFSVWSWCYHSMCNVPQPQPPQVGIDAVSTPPKHRQAWAGPGSKGLCTLPARKDAGVGCWQPHGERPIWRFFMTKSSRASQTEKVLWCHQAPLWS